MRYLGIDYGTRKVGLALSDEAGSMGFPHGVRTTDGKLENELLALVELEAVQAIVVGESLDFQGKENPVAAAARSFGVALSEKAGVPVYFEPERYTTQEARRFPTGERMPGSPDVDAAAAALILTSFLDRQNPARELLEPNDDA